MRLRKASKPKGAQEIYGWPRYQGLTRRPEIFERRKEARELENKEILKPTEVREIEG